jgi:uncharacterized protein
MTVDASRLLDLSHSQCLKLLAGASVGRVGVTIGALPVILPVNFVLVDEEVVFRTVPGTKLDAATNHAVVAFEADNHAPDGAWGWSVLIQGKASQIIEVSELAVAKAAPLRAWAFQGGVASRFVRIRNAFMSGRGFGATVRAMAPPDGPRPPALGLGARVRVEEDAPGAAVTVEGNDRLSAAQRRQQVAADHSIRCQR